MTEKDWKKEDFCLVLITRDGKDIWIYFDLTLILKSDDTNIVLVQCFWYNSLLKSCLQ